MTHLHEIATDFLVRILTTLVARSPSWDAGLVLPVVLAHLGLTPALVTKLRSTPTEGLLLVALSMMQAFESRHGGLDGSGVPPAEGGGSAAEFGAVSSQGADAADEDAKALAAILAKSERFEQGIVMPHDMLTPEELDAIGLDAARATIPSLIRIPS